MKPGDIVELRSGGPKMTITELHADGDVTLAWFDTDIAELGRARLPGVSLKTNSGDITPEPIKAKIASLRTASSSKND